MNIFPLGRDPRNLVPCPYLSAVYMTNRHVIKMILESSQLLVGALPLKRDLGLPAAKATETIAGYARTHFSHPCAVWTRSTRSNYIWLYRHATQLISEAKVRFNNATDHASRIVIEYCMDNIDLILFDGPDVLTEMPKAMPEVFKTLVIDTVTAYRMYYKFEKVLHDGKDYYYKVPILPTSKQMHRFEWAPIWLRVYPEESDYYEQYHKVISLSKSNTVPESILLAEKFSLDYKRRQLERFYRHAQLQLW